MFPVLLSSGHSILLLPTLHFTSRTHCLIIICYLAPHSAVCPPHSLTPARLALIFPLRYQLKPRSCASQGGPGGHGAEGGPRPVQPPLQRRLGEPQEVVRLSSGDCQPRARNGHPATSARCVRCHALHCSSVRSARLCVRSGVGHRQAATNRFHVPAHALAAQPPRARLIAARLSGSFPRLAENPGSPKAKNPREPKWRPLGKEKPVFVPKWKQAQVAALPKGALSPQTPCRLACVHSVISMHASVVHTEQL